MRVCPSRFSLVQLAVDELPAPEKTRIQDHLAACTSCAAIMAELSRDTAYCREHRERLLAGVRHELIEHPPLPLQHRPFFRRAILIPALSTAAAIVLALVFIGVNRDSRVALSPPTGIHFKGELALKAVVVRGQAEFELDETATLMPQDELHLIVTTSSPGYLTVFTLDEHGVITPVVPESDPTVDPAAWAVPTAGVHSLPGQLIVGKKAQGAMLVAALAQHSFNRQEAHQRLSQQLRNNVSRKPLTGTLALAPFSCEYIQLPSSP